jgi:uncharacterized membrane protein
VIGAYGGEDSAASRRCFLWRRGQITLLQTASGQFVESLSDINNRREILVFMRSPRGGTDRFVWRNGQLTRLELLPGFESSDHDPLVINDRGSVVGNTWPTGPVPVLWQDGTIMQIQLPQGARNGFAEAMNNRGVIVGEATNPGEPPVATAAIWPRRGEAVDLNALIADDDPLQPFLHLLVATMINDRGVIVANGRDSRTVPMPSGSSYLLTPQH